MTRSSEFLDSDPSADKMSVDVKKKKFLERGAKEGSHAENSLGFSLPGVQFLPSLDPFLPRFSAHICLHGFN